MLKQKRKDTIEYHLQGKCGEMCIRKWQFKRIREAKKAKIFCNTYHTKALEEMVENEGRIMLTGTGNLFSIRLLY